MVNGPEILDKFVGEAEKKVRELFAPAEAEWQAAGDASALHVIILDEMDAIARKRGAAVGDTSGVRDSVVNQLLAKMDGVVEASNVLVIGLTNRPELLDEALLRPGRFEVKLEVGLPDLAGRRDILRIHTRAMRSHGALAEDAMCFIDAADATCSLDELPGPSLPELTEFFSGAELAGLVRSAASFALGRAALAAAAEGAKGVAAGTIGAAGATGAAGVMVRRADFEAALLEVRPARGRRDEAMAHRFMPHGVGCAAHAAVRQQLCQLLEGSSPAKRGAASSMAVRFSMLLAPAGPSSAEDASALAAWAGCQGAPLGELDYVRFVSVAEMLRDSGTSEDARCRALHEQWAEARAMRRSLLILDDLDLLLAAPGVAMIPPPQSPLPLPPPPPPPPPPATVPTSAPMLGPSGVASGVASGVGTVGAGSRLSWKPGDPIPPRPTASSSAYYPPSSFSVGGAGALGQPVLGRGAPLGPAPRRGAALDPVPPALSRRVQPSVMPSDANWVPLSRRVQPSAQPEPVPKPEPVVVGGVVPVGLGSPQSHPPPPLAAASPLSPTLVGLLRSLLREPFEQGSDERPPALLVLATASSPAAAAALAHLFDATATVPLLTSSAEALDAMQSSPALAQLVTPRALEGFSQACADDARVPARIGVRPLLRLAERAAAASDDPEEQVRWFREMLQVQRL